MLVPGVGEVFRITNPGERLGENVLARLRRLHDVPQPAETDPQLRRRRVPAVETLEQPLADDETYLYSRLYGNYSGLTSSDENNRNAPSVNRFFDGQYYSFDKSGQPVFGFLQTDRPHVFKIEGFYDMPWGTGIGLYWLAESGTPLQTEMREKGIPFYPIGRNDLGRTAATTRTDLFLQHDVTFGRHRFNIGLNVENLFDQDTVTRNLHGAVPRHVQRQRSGVLQRHVRSGCAPGIGARNLPSGSALRSGGPMDAAARNAAAGQVPF